MTRITQRTVKYGVEGSEVLSRYGAALNTYKRAYSSVVRKELIRDEIRTTNVILPGGFKQPLPYKAEIDEPMERFGIVDYSFNAGRGYIASGIWNLNTVSGVTLNAPIVSTNMRNSVITKMLQRLGDTKLDLAVSMLEAREGIKLIGDTANVLQRALIYASRKRWRDVARTLRVKPKSFKDGVGDVSSRWLEYSFGWAPLISDMAKIAAVLGSDQLSNNAVIRAAAGASFKNNRESELSRSRASSVAYPNTNFEFIDRGFHHDRTDYKLVCYYKLDTEILRNFNRLGLLNAPSVVWARTPWSFVVDWLVDIGAYLEALTADVGLTFVAGSESTFRVSQVRPVQVGFVTNMSKPLHLSTNRLLQGGRRAEFTRLVLTESPLPTAPVISDPFSAWRTVTSVALAVQAAQKIK